MKNVTWYFDVISPFAYLQLQKFESLPDDVNVTYKPILLAGLLNHWGTVGPAEVPPKRLFTYQHVTWLAKQQETSFKMPPAHPFNPLKGLRLCIAAGTKFSAINSVFDYVWNEGNSLDDDSGLQNLAESLGINDVQAAISDPEVKQTLIKNTEEAIQQSVFGVPTLEVDGHLFWGLDAFEMFQDYLQNPALFEAPEMQKLEMLPAAVQRK